MLQPHVTMPPLIILGLAHLAAVYALFQILTSRRTVTAGWRAVGPSGMHWFCFAGLWALSAFITWIWIFVGSRRPDGDTQMMWALALALFFAVGAAWGGLHVASLRRASLRWRGAQIRWEAKGASQAKEMAGIVSAKRRANGALRLTFADGNVFDLDIHASNADAFLASISERRGEDIW
jgi:hypothetical protein